MAAFLMIFWWRRTHYIILPPPLLLPCLAPLRPHPHGGPEPKNGNETPAPPGQYDQYGDFFIFSVPGGTADTPPIEPNPKKFQTDSQPDAKPERTCSCFSLTHASHA